MHEIAMKFYDTLQDSIRSIQATDDNGEIIQFFQGIEEACRMIRGQTQKKAKLIFIGNGASAAISSHMAADFWKNGRMRALAFNDSSLLTCVGNDYGYEYVFEKPIEMFAVDGDVLMAISSSGRSPNILNGVKAAKKINCKVITFSGFSPDNPLRSQGDINFYVPRGQYGPVEILHHSICHCILDVLIDSKPL